MIDLRRPEIFGETDPRKDMVGINVSLFFLWLSGFCIEPYPNLYGMRVLLKLVLLQFWVLSMEKGNG